MRTYRTSVLVGAAVLSLLGVVGNQGIAVAHAQIDSPNPFNVESVRRWEADTERKRFTALHNQGRKLVATKPVEAEALFLEALTVKSPYTYPIEFYEDTGKPVEAVAEYDKVLRLGSGRLLTLVAQRRADAARAIPNALRAAERPPD